MVDLRTWDIRPLLPDFGGEVISADLTRPLDHDEVDQLVWALYEYKLLVFRGQSLDVADQIRLLGYFGQVADECEDGSYHSLLSTNRPGAVSVNDSLGFHNDFSFAQNPPTVESLYGMEIDPGSTPTQFRSTASAYRQLPAAMQERIAGLNAMRLHTHVQRRGRVRRVDLEAEGLSLADCVYSVKPIVLKHPVTGEPLLWLTKYHVSHIHEMEDDEGEQLLQDLFAHMNRCAVYEHQWSLADLLLWDNLALQHARPDPLPTTRTLRRVVANDLPMANMVGVAKN
jgi:taurine dioxygenase